MRKTAQNITGPIGKIVFIWMYCTFSMENVYSFKETLSYEFRVVYKQGKIKHKTSGRLFWRRLQWNINTRFITSGRDDKYVAAVAIWKEITKKSQ